MKFDQAVIRTWVAGVLAGIYKPEPNEEIWEWAERTLRIPIQENKDFAGVLWSSNLTPYVRELMRWVKKPGKGEFWIRKSSQTGFTMAVLIIICWMVVHRPCPMAYAINSIEEAKKISKVRLQNWILYNNLLKEIGEEEDSLNNLTFFFKSATVYMLSASSLGDWQNKSIEIFFMDELDLHPHHEGQGTTVEMARERCKRPPNSKIIGFSTPGATDQITTEYKAGTMEEVRFPFPCCGHSQALKKENLVFSSREFRDLAGGYLLDEVEKNAYFKCEMCGGKLRNHEKIAAMQACEYVPTNPKATRRVRSAHVWDAYSPFISFGDIALKWIRADGDGTLLERLYRGTFGEQFERSGATLKNADVLACRGSSNRDDPTYYEKGTLPFRPLWFIQVTDVQGDVQKTAKIAFCPAGNLWVIDWKITTSLSDAFDWIDVPVPGPDGEMFYCEEGFCDEGHTTKRIREECLERTRIDSLAAIWPVKGVDVRQVAELVSTNYRWVGGEGSEEILVYSIADRPFKRELIYMIKDRGKRAKKRRMLLYLPSDTDEDDAFVDELCNEHPFMKKNKVTGKEYEDWKKTGPNDFLDVVKYAIGMWTVKRALLRPQGIAA